MFQRFVAEIVAIFGMFHFEERAIIEQHCSSARFYILNSYDTDYSEAVFESDESILEWLWSRKHGVFDRALVTKERLQNYSQPYKGQEGKPYLEFRESKDLSANCRLIAVKPMEIMPFNVQLVLPNVSFYFTRREKSQ